MPKQYDDNPFAAPQSDIAPEEYSKKRRRVEYATFFARFAAAFLDGLILGVIAAVILVPVALALGRSYSDLPVQLMVYLVIFAIQWIYFAAQESSAAGATLGKRAAGVRVTDLNGHRISFGRATGRYFAKQISAFIFMIASLMQLQQVNASILNFIGIGFFLIAFLMQPFSQKKQALHDIMAGTLVIKQ